MSGRLLRFSSRQPLTNGFKQRKQVCFYFIITIIYQSGWVQGRLLRVFGTVTWTSFRSSANTGQSSAINYGQFLSGIALNFTTDPLFRLKRQVEVITQSQFSCINVPRGAIDSRRWFYDVVLSSSAETYSDSWASEFAVVKELGSC